MSRWTRGTRFYRCSRRALLEPRTPTREVRLRARECAYINTSLLRTCLQTLPIRCCPHTPISHHSIMKMRDAMSDTIQSMPSTRPAPVTALHPTIAQCRVCARVVASLRHARAGGRARTTRAPHHRQAVSERAYAPRAHLHPAPGSWRSPPRSSRPAAHTRGLTCSTRRWGRQRERAARPRARTRSCLFANIKSDAPASFCGTRMPTRVTAAATPSHRAAAHLLCQQRAQLCTAVRHSPPISAVHHPY